MIMLRVGDEKTGEMSVGADETTENGGKFKVANEDDLLKRIEEKLIRPFFPKKDEDNKKDKKKESDDQPSRPHDPLMEPRQPRQPRPHPYGGAPLNLAPISVKCGNCLSKKCHHEFMITGAQFASMHTTEHSLFTQVIHPCEPFHVKF